MSAGRIPTTANSPLTTKGDLFGYSTQPARLAVGSDGDTIVADSSTATGLKWAAPASGGGMTLLSTTTFSGSAVDINVASGYQDLYIVTSGVTATANFETYFRPNAITSTIYYQTGSTTASSSVNNVIFAENLFTIGPALSNQASSNTDNIISYRLMNYNSSTEYKMVQIIGGYTDSGSVIRVGSFGGVLRSTAQITSVRFQIQAAPGTTYNGGTIRIYGVK